MNVKLQYFAILFKTQPAEMQAVQS